MKRKRTKRRNKKRSRKYKMYSPTGIKYIKDKPIPEEPDFDDFENNPCSNPFITDKLYKCGKCDGREDTSVLTDIPDGFGLCHRKKCIDGATWLQAAESRGGRVRGPVGEELSSGELIQALGGHGKKSLLCNDDFNLKHIMREYKENTGGDRKIYLYEISIKLIHIIYYCQRELYRNIPRSRLSGEVHRRYGIFIIKKYKEAIDQLLLYVHDKDFSINTEYVWRYFSESVFLRYAKGIKVLYSDKLIDIFNTLMVKGNIDLKNIVDKQLSLKILFGLDRESETYSHYNFELVFAIDSIIDKIYSLRVIPGKRGTGIEFKKIIDEFKENESETSTYLTGSDKDFITFQEKVRTSTVSVDQIKTLTLKGLNALTVSNMRKIAGILKLKGRSKYTTRERLIPFLQSAIKDLNDTSSASGMASASGSSSRVREDISIDELSNIIGPRENIRQEVTNNQFRRPRRSNFRVRGNDLRLLDMLGPYIESPRDREIENLKNITVRHMVIDILGYAQHQEIFIIRELRRLYLALTEIRTGETLTDFSKLRILYGVLMEARDKAIEISLRNTLNREDEINELFYRLREFEVLI